MGIPPIEIDGRLVPVRVTGTKVDGAHLVLELELDRGALQAVARRRLRRARRMRRRSSVARRGWA